MPCLLDGGQRSAVALLDVLLEDEATGGVDRSPVTVGVHELRTAEQKRRADILFNGRTSFRRQLPMQRHHRCVQARKREPSKYELGAGRREQQHSLAGLNPSSLQLAAQDTHRSCGLAVRECPLEADQERIVRPQRGLTIECCCERSGHAATSLACLRPRPG